MSQAQPRQSRSERAAATRERILNSAIHLMSERGYAGSSVGEICERSGVTRPVLYFHFGSKEGLLGAVIDRVGNQWIDDLETRISVGEESDDPLLRAAARLQRATDGYRALIEEHPELLRVLLLVALESSDTSEEVREALKRFGRRALDAVAHGIQDALGRDLPDLDLVAHTVISLLEGALIRYAVDPEGTDLDRLWDELRRTTAHAVIYRVQLVDAQNALAAPSDSKSS